MRGDFLGGIVCRGNISWGIQGEKFWGFFLQESDFLGVDRLEGMFQGEFYGRREVARHHLKY